LEHYKKSNVALLLKKPGSEACTRVNSAGKARLLQTTVVSNFLWKSADGLFKKVLLLNLTAFNAE
jgi:hypothetical protein